MKILSGVIWSWQLLPADLEIKRQIAVRWVQIRNAILLLTQNICSVNVGGTCSSQSSSAGVTTHLESSPAQSLEFLLAYLRFIFFKVEVSNIRPLIRPTLVLTHCGLVSAGLVLTKTYSPSSAVYLNTICASLMLESSRSDRGGGFYFTSWNNTLYQWGRCQELCALWQVL